MDGKMSGGGVSLKKKTAKTTRDRNVVERHDHI